MKRAREIVRNLPGWGMVAAGLALASLTSLLFSVARADGSGPLTRVGAGMLGVAACATGCWLVFTWAFEHDRRTRTPDR